MGRPLPQIVEPPPPVRLLLSGEIALITLDNAPVNALSEQVRVHLRKSVQEACDNAAIKFIVIMAAKGSRCFSSGADIKEFAQLTPPFLPDVLNEIEQSRKLIIAAIDGPALGGGFELAMACHYRLATSRATFAVPEVKLGILPGAGGTQRLPRLVGVQTAVSWICTGRTVRATEALTAGAIDQCLDIRALELESSSSDSSDDDDDDTSEDGHGSDSDAVSTTASSDSSSSSSASSSSSSSAPSLSAVEAIAAREDRVWTHLLGAAIGFGNRLLREDRLRVITATTTTKPRTAAPPLLRRTSDLTAKLGNRFMRAAVLMAAERLVAAQTPPGMVSPMLALTAVRNGLAEGDFKQGLKAERAALVTAFATSQASALQHAFFAARGLYQLPPSLRIESRVRRRRAASVFGASGSNWPLSPQRVPLSSSRRHRASVVEVLATAEDEDECLATSTRSDTNSTQRPRISNGHAPPLSPQWHPDSSRVSRRTSLTRASSMAYAGPHAPPAGFVTMRRVAFLGHTRRVLRLTAGFLMQGLHVTILPVPLFDMDLDEGDATAQATSSRTPPRPAAGRHDSDDDVEVPLEEVEAFLLECLTPHSRDALEALLAVLEDMSFMTPAMLARLGKATDRPLTDPAAILLQQHMRLVRSVDEELLELDEVDIFLLPRPSLLGSRSARVTSAAAMQQYSLSVRTLLVRLEGVARAHALFICESRDDVRMALDVFSHFRQDRIFQLFSYPLPAVRSSRLSHHPTEPSRRLTGAVWEVQAVAAVPSNTAVEALLRFAKQSKLVLIVTRMNSPSHAEREEAGMDASGVWSRELSTAASGATPVVVPVSATPPRQSPTQEVVKVTTSSPAAKAAISPVVRKSPTVDKGNAGLSPVTPLLPEEVAVKPKRFSPPPALSTVAQASASALLDVEPIDPRALASRSRCAPIGLRLFARALFQLLVLIETEQATVEAMEVALKSVGFSHGAFVTLQFLGLEEVWEEICFQQSAVAAALAPDTTPPSSLAESSSDSPLVKGFTQITTKEDPLDDVDAVPSVVPSLPVVSELFTWLLAQRYAPQSPTPSTDEEATPVRGWYKAVVTSKPVGPVDKTPLAMPGATHARDTSKSKKKNRRSRAHGAPTASSSTATPSARDSSSSEDEDEEAHEEAARGDKAEDGPATTTATATPPPVAAPVDMEYQETTKLVLDSRVSAKLKAIREARASSAAGAGSTSARRKKPSLDNNTICRRFLYAMLDELVCVQRFNGVRDPRPLAALTSLEQQAYRDTPRMLGLRSADLDVLSIQAFGFPAWYGGIAYYATEPRFCSLFVAYRFLFDLHREEEGQRENSSGSVKDEGADAESPPSPPTARYWTAHPSPALQMSMLVPPRELWNGRPRDKDRRPTVSFNTVKVDVWN